MIERTHYLVVVKDMSSDRHLVYYDERWDCKLFPNYKGNEFALKEQVAADLRLNSAGLTFTYIASRVQEKYSVSHGEMRIYNHRLYEMHCCDFPEKFKKDNFVINGKHYYWMPMPEMEKDKNIQEKNLEVIDFVKEYIK